MKDTIVFFVGLILVMFFLFVFAYYADKQTYEYKIELEKVRCSK